MWKRILKIISLFLLMIVVGGSIYFLTIKFRWSDKKFISKLAEHNTTGEIVYTSTSKGDIRFVRSGLDSATSIVFLHGAPGSNKDFAKYMHDADLTSAANLMTVDRPGYGYSSYGKCMPSIKDQAIGISEVLPDHSILVGHSYGGPVAAALAMYFPEKVQELILLAPAVDPNFEKHFAINRIINHPALKWALSGALKVALEEKLTHEDALTEIMLDWSSITQPVTVVHGEKDNIVPYENMEFLNRVLTNSELQFLSPDNMNHIMIWTEYKWVKDLLLSKIEN